MPKEIKPSAISGSTFPGRIEHKGLAGHPEFYALAQRMCELHARKNQDYSGDLPFKNLRRSENIGIPAWKGVVTRMQDKWGRIEEFANKEAFKVKDESLEDTLLDNAVYSLICLILYRESKSQ